MAIHCSFGNVDYVFCKLSESQQGHVTGEKGAILCHINKNKTSAYRDKSSVVSASMITLVLCSVLGNHIFGSIDLLLTWVGRVGHGRKDGGIGAI